eukprot:scaffold233907_cov36-Tisochrysis_lutea.AAC.4
MSSRDWRWNTYCIERHNASKPRRQPHDSRCVFTNCDSAASRAHFMSSQRNRKPAAARAAPAAAIARSAIAAPALRHARKVRRRKCSRHISSMAFGGSIVPARLPTLLAACELAGHEPEESRAAGIWLAREMTPLERVEHGVASRRRDHANP